MVGEGANLGRGPRARRIQGVHVDRVELVVRQDLTNVAAFEFGPAHPSRYDGNAEGGPHTSHHAFGRRDLDSTFAQAARLFPPDSPGGKVQFVSGGGGNDAIAVTRSGSSRRAFLRVSINGAVQLFKPAGVPGPS